MNGLVSGYGSDSDDEEANSSSSQIQSKQSSGKLTIKLSKIQFCNNGTFIFQIGWNAWTTPLDIRTSGIG